MSYFHCYWFTIVDDIRREVDILIKHDVANRARMIASRYITNMSHFEEYPLDVREFGTCLYQISHEWELVDIISSVFTIRDGFELLTDIEMSVKWIDSINHPLKDNIKVIIWGMLRKEFGLSNDDPFTLIIEDDDADWDNLSPTQIIKITDLIAHILSDSKELYVKVKWIIGGDGFTQLTRSIEQLQQTLGQGQIMIAKEQTKKLINMMEKIEWEYIEYEKARDHKIQNQITIPNLNTILAHNQRATAHKLYEVESAEKWHVEQRYETINRRVFSKWTLYIKGMRSEMNAIVGPYNNITNYIIRKTEYTLIFMSILLLFALEFDWHRSYRGNILYIIWLIWLALQASHLIHTNNQHLKTWFIIWGWIVVWLIGHMIAINLALI
jgi:hypothetical protein